MARKCAKTALLVAFTPCLVMISHAEAADTPVSIISDHIRRQGYPCDEPRQAEHDRQASKPNFFATPFCVPAVHGSTRKNTHSLTRR